MYMETASRPYGAVEHAIEIRLRRIQGQIRGIDRMVAEGRPASDIVTQVAAVRSALQAVALEVVLRYVTEAVSDPPVGAEVAEDISALLRRLARMQ